MYSYIYHPPCIDVEAYTDAMPPTPLTTPTLSAYSNACWRLQIGSMVVEGIILLLLKFHSMDGGVGFCNGGPIGWFGEPQECTSFSSWEAKIHATSATSKKVVNF
jgi:hypothetical protein